MHALFSTLEMSGCYFLLPKRLWRTENSATKFKASSMCSLFSIFRGNAFIDCNFHLLLAWYLGYWAVWNCLFSRETINSPRSKKIVYMFFVKLNEHFHPVYRSFDFKCKEDGTQYMLNQISQGYNRNSKRAACNYQAKDALGRLSKYHSVPFLSCLATSRAHPQLDSCTLHTYHFFIVFGGNFKP